ncbi:hypothetical protein F970_00001, partial [Acinetobacter sp. CIP 102082]
SKLLKSYSYEIFVQQSRFMQEYASKLEILLKSFIEVYKSLKRKNA